MRLTTVVMVIVSVACAAVLAVKLLKLVRNPRDQALRALCLMLTGLTISVGIQPVAVALERFTRVQKLGGFLGEMAGLLAAGAGQVFLTRVYHRAQDAETKSRHYYRALAVILLILTIMFVLSPPDWLTVPGGSRSRALHLSVLPLPYLWLYPYFGYLAGTLVAVIRLCLRYAALTEHRYLRASLRTLAAGCVVGLAYTVTSLVAITLQEARMSVGSWKAATTTPLYLTTDALLLLGCTIPSLAAGWRWLLDRRARRYLQPLWLAVYRANPDIALFSHNTRPELRLQIYRQVIEIRDGQLALRPFLDPRAAQISTRLGHEAGLSEQDIAVVNEAATLAAAISAKTQRQPPHSPYHDPPTPRGGTDLATEIAWLQQVSRAFTTSPIVAHTVRLLTKTTPATAHPAEQLAREVPP